MGTFWHLPNGNTLLGYGQTPAMKEFVPIGDHDVRMTIRCGYDNNSALNFSGAASYGTYRQDWVGTPAVAPDAVVEDGVLYLSWNRATGISGTTETDLKAVANVTSGGFETNFTFSGNETSVKAAAFRGEDLLRYSNMVTIH